MKVDKRGWMFIGIGAIVFVLSAIVFFRPLFPAPAEEEEVDWLQIGSGDEEVVMEEQNQAEKVLLVDVKGEVISPGVYDIREGERMIDVIQRAGGMTADADETRVNLAAILEDEMVIYIPKIGEEEEIAATLTANDGRGQPRDTGKVEINRANSAELETLPGIGPAKAAAIISYREQHGPFKTIEDLLNISGIGPKSLEKLKDHVMIK